MAIVEMHGGRIEAASPGLGLGSTFTVVLPRGRAVAPPPVGADHRFDVTPAAQAPVIVADDNVDAAESLAALLELDGYAVYLALDGATALELAKSVKPVACFLDLGMPRVNGYEVARQLRGSRKRQRATVGRHDGMGAGGGPATLPRRRLRCAPDQTRRSDQRLPRAGRAPDGVQSR